MTEREKMIAGAPYSPAAPELEGARARTALLRLRFNATTVSQSEEYRAALKDLCPNVPSDFMLIAPFFCDYGQNIYAGEACFVNGNCTFLDEAPIRLGSRVLIGPNVQLFTAQHPLDAQARATGIETARPITIGDDCWLGGGVCVCPGVRIGERSVVGAGSVVTRDVPPDSLAAGNPARIVRTLGK